MTAVDHAELKRLAEGAADGLHGGRASPRVIFELLTAGWERQVPRATDAPTMADAEYIVAACRDLPTLLSEIEGLKAERDAYRDAAHLEAVDGDAAEAALRTQAPDSWRPDREAVFAAMATAILPKKMRADCPVLYSASDVVDEPVLGVMADAVCAALRPQTAESGK